MALPSYLHPSTTSTGQTLSWGHRWASTTNHLSNGIDQCRKYGNSMATHCDDVSSLLSKTWQSIVQDPIKVDSRMQWPQVVQGSNQKSMFWDRGLKPWRVWSRNKSDYWQKRQTFSYVCFGDGHLFKLQTGNIADKHREKRRKYLWSFAESSMYCEEFYRLYSKGLISDTNVSDSLNRDMNAASFYFLCHVFDS